jgi:subtilisin family serine protease
MKITMYLPLSLLIAICAGRIEALAGQGTARVLIKWKDGPTSIAAVAGNAQIGGTVKRNFNALGWQLVELPQGLGATGGIAAYRTLDAVAAVEADATIRMEPPLESITNSPTPSGLLKSLVIPNDPSYGSQWYLPLIGAPAAWDVTTGGSNVVVAIFDSGVDYTHPDLAPNMWHNPGETGLDDQGRDKATNGLDDDANGYVDDVHGINVLNGSGDPMDTGFWNSPGLPAANRIYHGTHIAGVIGAVGNNGQGIAGINWSTRIMALRTAGGDFADPNWELGYWSDNLAAWDYVVAMKRRGVNIRVTNHSYAGAVVSIAMREAFALAGGEGILNVTIAQNFGHDNDVFSLAPGALNHSSIINVAASSESDALASFSSFGASTVDLAAPGRNLTLTSGGGTYATGSGTSYAAPVVVGAAALLLSANPNLTVDELKGALFGSVDQPAALRGKVRTHGRLNIARALEYLTNANPPAIVITSLPAGQRTRTNAPIQVTFSRAMDRASVEPALVIQPPVIGTFEWAADNRSFTFHHDAPFDSATNYIVKILGTARDESGGTLDGNFNRTRESSPADDFVWTFRFPISNDDFVNAQELAGAAGSIQSSNRYASAEPDELFGLLFGDWRAYGSSVWYQWTGAADGWITFDLTSSTAFDSLLAVFTGDQLDRLAPVNTSDNYGSNQGSRVSLGAFAGTNYSVLVASKDSYDVTKSGNFQLRWYPTPPPVITSFAPITAYPGQKITLNGTNFTGTTRVLFNGVPAVFALATNVAFLDLTLGVTVPVNATTGPLTIETGHGNFITASPFSVLTLPKLTVHPLPAANLVELSWPSTAGFNLQRTERLGSTTSWVAASFVTSRLTNGYRVLTVTNAVPNRFFRLYRP